MRRVMIPTATLSAAKSAAPWAAKIVKVVDGYMAFESMTDYEIWRKQK